VSFDAVLVGGVDVDGASDLAVTASAPDAGSLDAAAAAAADVVVVDPAVDRSILTVAGATPVVVLGEDPPGEWRAAVLERPGVHHFGDSRRLGEWIGTVVGG